MKNKIIIISIFIGFLFMLLPFNNTVNATSVTYPIDFELPYGHKNQQYDDGFLKTTRKSTGGATFNVTDSNPRSGVLDFVVGGSFTSQKTVGFWNFTYSVTKYLTSIELGFGHLSAGGSGYSTYAIFYNKTTQGSLLNLVTPTTANAQLYAMAYLGFIRSGTDYFIQTKVGQQKVNASEHEFVRIDITNSDGYQKDYYRNYLGTEIQMGVEHTPYNSTVFVNGGRIDACYFFTLVGTTGCSVFFDDLNFTVSSSYTIGAGGIDEDFSGYNTIGRFPSSQIFRSGVQQYETKTDYDFTGKLYGFDLFTFSDSYYSWWASLWSIGINGNIFTPTSTFNVSLTGIHDTLHVIRFNFKSTPVDIQNENIIIEIYNPNKVAISLFRGDVDNDGDTNSRYGNGIYIDGSYNAPSVDYANEPCFLLYYIGSTGTNPTPIPPYAYLEISNNRYTSPYNNSLIYYRNDSCIINYGVTDLTVLNTITVYNNGHFLNDYGFNYTILNNQGTTGLRLSNLGNYTISLRISGINYITRYVFVLVNPNPDDNNYQISSSPPITTEYQTYRVYYNYYNLNGYNGYIGVFKYSSDTLNYTNSFMPLRLLDDNTSGSFEFIHSYKDTNHLWQIFVYVNGQYIPKGSIHIHYILNTESTNYITINYGQDFGQKPTINFPLFIQGSHNQLGEIYIYLNGYKSFYVGSYNSFNVQYIPTKTGILNASLILLQQNRTKLLLAYDECIVIKEETPPPSGEMDIGLEAPYTYIAGTILTLILLILPSIVIGKTGFQSEILKYVPLFSGILGFIVSCMMGFFPWYAVFGLVLVLVIVLAVIYQSKKG